MYLDLCHNRSISKAYALLMMRLGELSGYCFSSYTFNPLIID